MNHRPVKLVVAVFAIILQQGALPLTEAAECTVNHNGVLQCGDSCIDKVGHEQCFALAQQHNNNGCITDFPAMRLQCQATCQLCKQQQDEDYDSATWTPQWASPLFSRQVPQIISTPETLARLQQVETYMYETVYMQDEYADVRMDCQNRNQACTYWAAIGECERNLSFMLTECSAACMACDLLSYEKRCPFDPQAPTALRAAGDLDALFERILTDPQLAPFSPHALMRPNKNSHSNTQDDTTPTGPWIIVLDDFLTAYECETLIRLGAERGYEQSIEIGDVRSDGSIERVTTLARTSSNSWCLEACADHPVTVAIHDRLELLTGIPRQNYEYLQMLQYRAGQYYEEHHDFAQHHLERPQGARTLTVFLYLNDVEAGGATRFGALNLQVTPKRGRALIWPSVLNDNPNAKDERTVHEALPVEAGIKYGANAWIHQRDYKAPFHAGCD